MVRRLTRYLAEAHSDDTKPSFTLLLSLPPNRSLFLAILAFSFMRRIHSFDLFRLWSLPLIFVHAIGHTVTPPLLLLLNPLPFTPDGGGALFWFRTRRVRAPPLILVLAMRHTISTPLLTLLIPFPFTPGRDATPSNVSLM